MVHIMLIKFENGKATRTSIAELIVGNPSVSFPETMTNETLAEFGVYECVETEKPNIDHTKNLIESFVKESDGWVLKWEIVNASDIEISERTFDAWANLRAERNSRLSETDWTQGKDISDDVSTVWASYRQALRDLPQNTQDPFNPVWPTKPE